MQVYDLVGSPASDNWLQADTPAVQPGPEQPGGQDSLALLCSFLLWPESSQAALLTEPR